jgi:hypothetical protein
MKVRDAQKLIVGAPVAFFDMTALIYFNGTVGSITPYVSMTVNTPGGANYPPAPLPPGAVTKPTTQTLSLDRKLDGDVELPLLKLI